MVKYKIEKKPNTTMFIVKAKGGDPPVKSVSTTKIKAQKQIKKIGMAARLARKTNK
jgi:hypothetical protein